MAGKWRLMQWVLVVLLAGAAAPPTAAATPTVPMVEAEIDREGDELADEAFAEEDQQAKIDQMVDELLDEAFADEEQRARIDQMVEDLLGQACAGSAADWPSCGLARSMLRAPEDLQFLQEVGEP